MLRQKILDKVIKVIVDTTNILDDPTINGNTMLGKDLGLDSMDRAEVSFNLEREFNVVFADTDFTDTCTLGRIVDFLLSANVQ